MTSSARSPRRLFSTAIAVVAAAVLTAMAVLAGASPASAHTGDQAYLYLDVTETSLSGRVEAPVRDLNEALDLDIGGTDDEINAAVEADLGRIHAYLADHLVIEVDGVEWPERFEGAELFFSELPEADDNYVLFPFVVDTAGDVPRTFEVTFDAFFEIEDRDALLLIGNDWQGGVIDAGANILTTYDPDNRTQTVDLGDSSWIKTVTASGKLGLDHIRTGPDHILFVLVLVLPAVLVFTNRWEPTETFGSSLWRVLKIVTMFTVAHSITFTLAGIDVLPLPSPRIVESIIAISIAAAALHNIRPIAPNKEWLISFVFGLFHGMGFASLVSGLDVDRSTQLLSLLGRNIGIEIGQAVVVLLLFPGLFFLRRTVYYQGFFVVMSLLLAAISTGWMIERLFEVEIGVSNLVDPVVEWPRVLIIIAVFTAVAYGLFRLERGRQRLLDTAGTPPVDEMTPVASAV